MYMIINLKKPWFMRDEGAEAPYISVMKTLVQSRFNIIINVDVCVCGYKTVAGPVLVAEADASSYDLPMVHASTTMQKLGKLVNKDRKFTSTFFQTTQFQKHLRPKWLIGRAETPYSYLARTSVHIFNYDHECKNRRH